MYIIFGCGVTGSAVVDSLHKSGKKLLIVDKDENALAPWREQQVNVAVSDMESFDVDSPIYKNSNIFAILTGDTDGNLSMVKRIKEKTPDNFIIVKASNKEEAEALESNGADEILHTGNVLAKTVLSTFDTFEMDHSAFTLVNTIKELNGKEMAIFLQDNPDPDAIASGLTLKYICKYCDVESTLYYGGNISHQKNKALINLLNMDLISIKTKEAVMEVVRSAGKIALIEASIPSRNNVLPEDVTPNLIFDHHQVDISAVKGDFVDIQTNIGATSTIMTKYIRQLNLKPDTSLATALLYGIRTDTKEFTRNTSPDDLNAASYLSPLVDNHIMSLLEHPPMSLETLDIIGRAIRNKEIRGSYLASFVEFINDRDALPQAAEMMLQLEGVYTVLVFGINDDKVQLSARSRDSRVNLGLILQSAFGELNSGGHATMAAGAINLGILGDANDRTSLLKVTSDAVKKRFFSSVGTEFEAETMPTDEESQVNLV
ncbi:exopolyphosphatase-related proteins [Candidatus Scalindua japonica]|uniref:Exopolyphosphatase-related proteins n=1 Tax=Candidatus Scalindua japonica TaxID=1284222 RepID=A0A286TY03_9BACT|nr:DHH family phosphoesterase [Candidatus Scalindua japonica]GAX60768.1 exopolyphosphatase-related proteins [Candidatus Scalindua japonica]